MKFNVNQKNQSYKNQNYKKNKNANKNQKNKLKKKFKNSRAYYNQIRQERNRINQFNK